MTNEAKAPDDQPPRQPLAPRLAEVALIGLVFFIMAGDPPPGVNEPHYLARLKHFWNPEWCAGDLFLESTDTQVALIWLFGWVTRWLSLPATAWVGRIVAWTMLAWAWQRLSWRLVPRPFAAPLSASLFVTLNTIAHMAGEWVVGGVEAKCFAYAFVVMALRELVDGRWSQLWLWIGAATAFHPLVGGWSGLICAAIWLIDRNAEISSRLTFQLRSMLPGVIGGTVLALIGIVPALTLTWNQPPEVVAEANQIYVFQRLPHHLALLTLPPEEVTLRIAHHTTLLAALVGLIVGFHRQGLPASSLRRIGYFALGAVLIAAAGFSIELTLWNRPQIAASLLRYYWFRLSDFALPMAVALYAVAFVAAGVQQERKWAPATLLAVLALVGWQLSNVAWARFVNPIPPADGRIQDHTAWVDACNWIAKNTPPDAVFLTPRSSQSFKWRTGRSEVATRKDIPQDAQHMVEWRDRLKNIFTHEVNGLPEWADSPGELGAERLKQLAAEYDFDYVLADRGELVTLPVVYMNEDYVVYRTSDRKPADVK